MEKKVLNEIQRMLFLTNYETGKLISEQPEVKTKSGSLNLDIGGGRNKAAGIQRGGMDLDVGFTYYKELDKELSGPTDLIQKMNSELSSSFAYKSLTSEQKSLLGNAFYEALDMFLDNPKVYLSTIDDKNIKAGTRRLKKFFKKSQKWKFVVDQATIPKEKQTVKVDLEGALPEDLLPAQQVILESMDEKFNMEAIPENVLASQGNIITGLGEDGGFINETISKLPLSFVFTTEKEKLKTLKLKNETTKTFESTATVDIPQIPLGYVAGKDDPTPFLPTIMSKINEGLYDTEVKYTNPKTKSEESMTIKQMIECNRSGTCGIEFDISIKNMWVVSSASNTWTGLDVLDFTHENDGTESKYWSSLDRTGNNLKNQILSKSRGDKLATIVAAKLKQSTEFTVPDDTESFVKTEYRVTDTGGKIDSKRTLSNPGQYAEFGFLISVNTNVSAVEPAESEMSGKLSNACIRLAYIGGKNDRGLGISVNIGFSERMFAQYVDGRKGLSFMRMGKMKRRGKKNFRRGVRKGSHVKPVKRK